MADINLKLDADQYALVAGVLKADDAVKNLIKNTTKLGPAGKRSGKELNEGFKGFAKTAASIAAGMGIVGGIKSAGQAVMGQLNREIDRIKQRQDRSATTQMNLGQMRNWAILNKPQDVSVKQLENLVQSTSRKYNIKQTEIWPSMGGILSAKGALPWSKVVDATHQGVRLYKRAGADIGMTAGAAMDVMRLSPKANASQALGFVVGGGQQMRVGEYEKQVAVIPPVMSAANAFGWTARQGVAMLGYTTMASGDFTGKKGRTATINLMATLDKARTKSGGLIPRATVSSTGKKGYAFDPIKKTGFAALGELQDEYALMSEAERTEFRAKMPGQAQTKGAILNLIARKPEAVAGFAAAMKGIGSPGDPSAAKPWEAYHKIAAAGKFAPIRGAMQAFGTAIEENELNDPYAISAVIRKGMEKKLASLPGGSDMGDRIASAMREFKGGIGETSGMPRIAIEELKAIRANRKFSEPEKYFPGAGMGGGGMYDNPNYRPAADATILRLIESLEKMAAELERRNRDTRDPGPRAHGE